MGIGIELHAVIHMSSGDKMEPFLASEMALVCHVFFYARLHLSILFYINIINRVSCRYELNSTKKAHFIF